MLVSELISQLTDMMVKHGNLPVKHTNHETGKFEDVYTGVIRRDYFNFSLDEKDSTLYITL